MPGDPPVAQGGPAEVGPPARLGDDADGAGRHVAQLEALAARHHAHVGDQREVDGGLGERAGQASHLLAGAPAHDAHTGVVGVGQQTAVEGRRATPVEAHRCDGGGAHHHCGADRVADRDGQDAPRGGRVELALRGALAERRGGRDQAGGDQQRGDVGRPQPAAALDHAADGGRGVPAPGRGQHHHQRPPEPEGREADRRDERIAEGEGARRHDPEGPDHLMGEHADAETDAVAERPAGQRPLAAPALGHLTAQLGQRDADEARLTGRRHQRERRHDAERPLPVERCARQAEHQPQHRRAQHRSRREEGDCDAVALTAPAPGGSEGLDHGEPSGGPRPRDPRDQGRRDDGELGQHGTPVSTYITQNTRRPGRQ